MDQETKQEFEGVHEKFVDMDNQFAGMREQFALVNKRLDEGFAVIGKRFDSVDKEINDVLLASQKASDYVQKRLDSIEVNMVTKHYLDDKLANFARTNNLRLREEGPEYNK